MSAWRALLLSGFVGGFAACGGAAPAAKGPASSTGDVDALTDELEAAERTLAAELGPPPAAPPPPAEPAAGGEGRAAEEKKTEEPAATPSPEPAAQAAPPRSPCETSCKALGSMKRSQARICEIVGEAHARCEWAKQKVTEATTRVERAGCECP